MMPTSRRNTCQFSNSWRYSKTKEIKINERDDPASRITKYLYENWGFNFDLDPDGMTINTYIPLSYHDSNQFGIHLICVAKIEIINGKIVAPYRKQVFAEIANRLLSEYGLTSNSNICHGQLCFAGTRILVWVVVDLIDGLNSDADVLEQLPTLTPEQLDFAYKIYKENKK